MKEVIALFEEADKELGKKIDTSLPENRELIYKVVLKAYTTGSRRGDITNQLVNIGTDYVDKGLEHIKASANHPK